MRDLHLIANWKMQLDPSESVILAKDIARLWSAESAVAPGIRMTVCASSVAVAEVAAALKGTGVAVGAQDCFWEDKGAYTGETSPLTLKTLGCEACIVGHSERRQFLGETDEMISRKTTALLRLGLMPIICVGETYEERQQGRRDAVVISQVRAALSGARPVGTQRIVIAYEPRWVIGTGQAVEPDDAAAMHRLIRETLRENYPSDVVERQFAVVYGGSADSRNLVSFLGHQEIDGLLVGGASLKADEFVRMARLAADLNNA